MRRRVVLGAILAAAFAGWLPCCASAQNDPLPAWTEGPAKTAILEFVKRVTTEGVADFVPAAAAHPRLSTS